MSAKIERVLRGLFFAYVVATAAHIAYVVHHEPFAFDAWNVAVDTGAEPASVRRFFEFWYHEYTSSNPRLGQPLTYLAYKLEGVAEVGTPLAFLAIVLGGFVFATRRGPDLRRGRDLAVLTVGIGFMWFAAPSMPAYMFCRAYATNYLWTTAILMWFLVVLRRHDPTAAPPSLVRSLGFFAFGVAAGMCNEHTGPTLVLFTAGYAAWIWRRQRRIDRFVTAGAIGALVGFGLIFFAPGQGQRYSDFLAVRMSLTEQIVYRGFRGNLEIIQTLLFAAAPLMVVFLAILVIGLVQDRPGQEPDDAGAPRREAAIGLLGWCFAACILMTITLFASPKLGPRFYMHGMSLVLGALLGVLLAFVRRPRSLAPFVVVALLASTYAAVRTIPLYTTLSRDSEVRLAELASAPSGSIYTAEAWEQVGESWWFLGDDFRDQKKRELVADYFGLQRVLFRAPGTWAVLGVSDVKLVMDYEIEPPVCLDRVEGLDLQPYIGRDVSALHRAFLDAIAEIRRRNPGNLHRIDLVATFVGGRPPMPRPRIYVARWADDRLEGYVTTIRRRGRSKDREVLLSPDLKHQPWQLYIVALGSEPRLLGTSTADAPLTYQPWQTGTYWILACNAEHCFVTKSLHHRI